MGICSGTSIRWFFIHCSRSNWNLALLILRWETWRKTLGARTKTNNKLNPHNNKD